MHSHLASKYDVFLGDVLILSLMTGFFYGYKQNMIREEARRDKDVEAFRGLARRVDQLEKFVKNQPTVEYFPDKPTAPGWNWPEK